MSKYKYQLKHTPGPWNGTGKTANPECGILLTDNRERTDLPSTAVPGAICEIKPPFYLRMDDATQSLIEKQQEEMAANEQLIRKAPQLLAKLAETVGLYDDLLTGKRTIFDVNFKEEIVELDKLIKSALLP